MRISTLLQKLAEELELRLQQNAPFDGNCLSLCQATWGLSQLMRADCSWDSLFELIGQVVMHSNERVDPGPASTFLKAAATYRVVHGRCPLLPEVLDYLVEGLMVPDPQSSGPQVCFWALLESQIHLELPICREHVTLQGCLHDK